MVAGLFKEIKKIFTGDKLEKEKQKGRGLEGAMKRDDVGVGGERLVNRSLRAYSQTTAHTTCIYALLTSNSWAVSASWSRFAFDSTLIAYSRPYSVDECPDDTSSKSMRPRVAAWPSSEG